MSVNEKKITKYSSIPPAERLPYWLKRSIGKVSDLEKVDQIIKSNKLHTICEEGRCPNRGECYAAGTATFLLGGSICSRTCAFCQVNKLKPMQGLDLLEPSRVANAVSELGLSYVVLTSVARDDLKDHGASLFTLTIEAIRNKCKDVQIEILTPDFWGGFVDHKELLNAQKDRLLKVLSSKPVCFNHNLETVERLQKEVRRGATYIRSLNLLLMSAELAPEIPTKSGLMLGLGEEYDEVIKTLEDLRSVDCKRITIGQYLRPSLAHIPVQKYWSPEEFKDLEKVALELGFSRVNSGPLVRSSYHAKGD